MKGGEAPAVVTVCPGGPVLLRGEHVVVDDTGQEHRTHRPVSAVCVCGFTACTPPQRDGGQAMNRAFPMTFSIGTVPSVGSPVHNSPR